MDDKFILYLGSIMESLKTLAGGSAGDAVRHTDLTSIATKVEAIGTKLDTVANKLTAIEGRLNPLYTEEYQQSTPPQPEGGDF